METLHQLARRNDTPASAPVVEALRADWVAMGKAWVADWKDALSGKSFATDLLSGLTVAAVALPLNLALALACNLPASAGLVAGAVGGVVVGMLGGAPLQIAGPAAALQVMVLGLSTQYGGVGVAAATCIIGVVLLILSLVRAGHLARYVPESVLAGFTTGVGLKLLDGQIPELLGFDYRVSHLATVMHQPDWLHEVQWPGVVAGLFVALLVVALRPYKRVPAAILGLVVVTFVANFLKWDVTRVGEVPSAVPKPLFPVVPDDQWLDLIIATLPLAFLAAAESLLSASVIDRMAQPKRPHQPSLELFGQGWGNFLVGLFGGMPVTGVVVRSGLNVQSGAKTRIAAIAHGVFLGGAVLLFGEYLSLVPLAALAGLLLVIGFRLIEVGTLIHLFQTSKLEALAFIVALVGTVTGNLMTGILLGLAIHFVYRFLKNREQPSHATKPSQPLKAGVRAHLGKDHAEARRVTAHAPVSGGEWLPNVKGQAIVPGSAFVHPKASVIGHVVLGENVHIAAGSSVRADEGTPFFIGRNSNVQDGVVIHALKDKRVMVGDEGWAVYVGENVSMAHDALVHGPCYIGDDSFIGFKAVVHDSVVGAGCFVGIGAVVVGVEVPPGRFVPHGHIVDTHEKAQALPQANDSQAHFNEDVVEVNRGLAAAYHAAVRAHRPLPRPQAQAEAEWGEGWGRAEGPSF